MRRDLIGGLLAALVLLPAVSGAAEVVTECGQTVEGAAVLAADLDCTGAADKTIVLEDGSLDLAGHTLAADVACRLRPSLDQRAGDCVITGPCTVRGCVHGYRLQADGVDFSYASGLCADNQQSAIYSLRSAVVSHVTITGYPLGGINSVIDSRMHISDSVVQHTGIYAPAVASGRLKIVDSVIEGEIVVGQRASLKNTQVTGVAAIYEGLEMQSEDGVVKLVGSSITGMSRHGIHGGSTILKRSDVSGNCLGGATGCVDIRAEGELRASRSTCGTSFCEPLGASCGVCAGD